MSVAPVSAATVLSEPGAVSVVDVEVDAAVADVDFADVDFADAGPATSASEEIAMLVATRLRRASEARRARGCSTGPDAAFCGDEFT
jgi:hypothetical protein